MIGVAITFTFENTPITFSVSSWADAQKSTMVASRLLTKVSGAWMPFH